MNITLHIDSKELAKHTARLREIHRSKLPIAARQTLDSVAFDVKKVTMPETSNVFEHRKPTFFQANSKVVKASGFDINKMHSIIGFIPKADAKDTSVSDLEQQEHSGDIHGRAFIPLKDNRVGGSWTGNVKAAGRWRAVQNKIVDSMDSGAKNNAGKFRSSAKHAGVGGYVIGTKVNSKGNRMVFRIDSLGKKMKLKAAFAVKAKRVVTPEATHFMEKASVQSGHKMVKFYIEHATKQINGMKK